MFLPRIIPVLLLRGSVLVKSRQFRAHKYIGDPINAVKIFNDLKADELAFLDINATKEGRGPQLDFVKDVGAEANMPFAVGGGIRTIECIRKLLSAGAEKAIVNSFAAEEPGFIRKAADTFGSSTITVCIDVKKKFFRGPRTWIHSGKKSTKYSPVDFAKLMEEMGAGELLVQSIERDGEMGGYDLALIREISEAVTVPVVALGGAGTLSDLKKAYVEGYASALAAGSLFVYNDQKRGVLINYPEKGEVLDMFSSSRKT